MAPLRKESFLGLVALIVALVRLALRGADRDVLATEDDRAGENHGTGSFLAFHPYGNNG